MYSFIGRLLLPLAIMGVNVCFGQSERVYLQLDKYTAWPGDTLWFKGYIFQHDRLSRVSTNLYVELFNEQGTPLSSAVFPIFNGESFGQVKVPDDLPSSNCFLRASTQLQYSYDSVKLFTVPVLIFNRHKDTTVFHKSLRYYSNFYTSNLLGKLRWVTQSSGGKIFSQVGVEDPVPNEYAVSILQKIRANTGQKDSSVVAEFTLSYPARRFAVFARDSTQEYEYLYLFHDSVLIGKQYLHFRGPTDSIRVTIDSLNTNPFGRNAWTLHCPDSVPYSISVSITDADRGESPPISIAVVDSSHTDDLIRRPALIDTSFLCIRGHATTDNGKGLPTGKKQIDQRLHELVVMGSADSGFLFTKVLPLDPAGNFSIDRLFVFDRFMLNFQLNAASWKGKNVALHLEQHRTPVFDTTEIREEWSDDIPITQSDTVSTKTELSAQELARMKTLQSVTVKGWKNPRSLDKEYTTGVFTEPTLFAFDTRKDSSGMTLIEYLRRSMGAIDGGYSAYDTPTYMGHKMIFYKGLPGETPQVQMWPLIANLFLQDIAYIKCWESDFVADDFDKIVSGVPLGFTWDSGGGALKLPSNKTPMIVAIFTKKEADYRLSPGGLNQIAVKGYSKMGSFRSDRVTLYWNPALYGHTIPIIFNNNDHTRRFRLVAEGVNKAGKVLHLEKIIE